MEKGRGSVGMAVHGAQGLGSAPECLESKEPKRSLPTAHLDVPVVRGGSKERVLLKTRHNQSCSWSSCSLSSLGQGRHHVIAEPLVRNLGCKEAGNSDMQLREAEATVLGPGQTT